MCRARLASSFSGLEGLLIRVGNVPSVAARSSRPGPHAVVGADEEVAGVDGVVAVGVPADLLAVDDGVVRAEGIREGGRGSREKGRRERARRSLRKDADTGLESKGESRQRPTRRLLVLLFILYRVALRRGIAAVVAALLCERRVCARAGAAPRRDKHYAQLR